MAWDRRPDRRNPKGPPSLAEAFGDDIAKRVADWLDYDFASDASSSTSQTVDPVDLWAQFDPPELPLGLLPKVIEDFATQQGDMMGADPAGLAMAALAVCAAAIADRIQLRVKRHDSNWMESARLWVALIGSPSCKKTPIINAAAKPIIKIDTALWRRYANAKAKYDALPAEERKLVRPPKQVRLRIEDTTIEAAQEVLKDSPDGVLCLQDETALGGDFDHERVGAITDVAGLATGSTRSRMTHLRHWPER